MNRNQPPQPPPTRGDQMYQDTTVRPDGIGFVAATQTALGVLRAGPERLARVLNQYRRAARAGRVGGPYADGETATAKAARAVEQEQASLQQARATVERALAAVAAVHPRIPPETSKEPLLFTQVRLVQAEIAVGFPALDQGLALVRTALDSNGGEIDSIPSWQGEQGVGLSEPPISAPAAPGSWYDSIADSRYRDALNRPADEGQDPGGQS